MSETLVKTEYHVYASDMCETHKVEHIVSGFGTDKALVGKLNADLVKILRNDWPECKLNPKPVLAGIDKCYRNNEPLIGRNGKPYFKHRWEVVTV